MRLPVRIGTLLAFIGLSQPAPLPIWGKGSSSAKLEDQDSSSLSHIPTKSGFLGIHVHEGDARHVSVRTKTVITDVPDAEDGTKGYSVIEPRQVTLNMILRWFENAGITLEEVLEDHGLLHAH